MALPKLKEEATAARLDTLTVPEDAGWTTAAREAALMRLRAQGLPARRDEYWRFTDPADFNAADVPEGRVMDVDLPDYADLDTLKIVFVDGVFDAGASDDLAETGCEIARLAEAQSADIHWARDLYGALEERGQVPVDRPFAALNTAFATDGVLIRATQVVERPIALIYHHTKPDSDVILHHVIRVEDGADLTLLETGPAGARYNTAMEVDVAENGAFHHIRNQGRTHMRRAQTHSFARLAGNATVKSFTLTMNGALTRNEHVVEFTGDEAVAHVAGAAIGDGADDPFHHDDTVFVTHDAVNCESRQVFKKVLKNGAVGVFQGKILVKADAQKTDGYQISQSLLLDDDSQFLAKPELEIYADDVACSHGSTTGAIDEEALFYLRARGIEKSRAEDLMVLAFLAEAILEIEDEDIAAVQSAELDSWLTRRAG